MTAFFRTVYFRPRLALDWRVPVAALLSVGDETTAVAADLLPDQRCLGGAGASELLRYGVAKLATSNDDSLPLSLGPHFEIGPRETVPSGLMDPAKWVKKTALPRPVQAENHTEPYADKRLPTLAYNHLSNWGVAGYVRKRFRPSTARELHRLPPKVGAVTHFVMGSETVLLMEPVVLSGAGVDDRVASIYSKFSAYSQAWDPSMGRQKMLVAYVLPGPEIELSFDDLTAQLHPLAMTYNTGTTDSRSRFTDEIRRIGDTGPKPELVR